jgi:hypothetical protein
MMKTNLTLRLSEKEWTRVLEEGRRVAAGAAPRLSIPELIGFIRERIEIHLEYILMMRPLRTPHERLIPMPDRIKEELPALIREESLETLREFGG